MKRERKITIRNRQIEAIRVEIEMHQTEIQNCFFFSKISMPDHRRQNQWTNQRRILRKIRWKRQTIHPYEIFAQSRHLGVII